MKTETYEIARDHRGWIQLQRRDRAWEDGEEWQGTHRVTDRWTITRMSEPNRPYYRALAKPSHE